MPGFPDYPSRDEDEEERTPDPERIIDRIIGGRLAQFDPSTGPGPSVG